MFSLNHWFKVIGLAEKEIKRIVPEYIPYEDLYYEAKAQEMDSEREIKHLKTVIKNQRAEWIDNQREMRTLRNAIHHVEEERNAVVERAMELEKRLMVANRIISKTNPSPDLCEICGAPHGFHYGDCESFDPFENAEYFQNGGEK